MATLSGFTATIKAAARQIYSWPVQIVGLNSSGDFVPLKLADDGTLTATVTGSGTQRTPTISTLTGSSSIAAGSRKLTMVFSSDFTGSVLGVAFVGGTDTSITIDAPSGDTIGAVSYVVTTGSIRAIKVV